MPSNLKSQITIHYYQNKFSKNIFSQNERIMVGISQKNISLHPQNFEAKSFVSLYKSLKLCRKKATNTVRIA